MFRMELKQNLNRVCIRKSFEFSQNLIISTFYIVSMHGFSNMALSPLTDSSFNVAVDISAKYN